MKKIIFIPKFIFLLMFTSCSTIKYQYELFPIYWAKKHEDVQGRVFAGEVEPPIPTLDELNSNVLGVDRNNNRIRDDLDIWINRVAANENELLALRQMANAYQTFLDGAVEKRFKDADMLLSDIYLADSCLSLIEAAYFYNAKRLFELEEKVEMLFFYPEGVKSKFQELAPYLISAGFGVRGGTAEDFYVCKFDIKDKKFVFSAYEKKFKIR